VGRSDVKPGLAPSVLIAAWSCDLTVHQHDGQIVRVTSPLEHSVTHGNLCIKGRFGWQFVQIQPSGTQEK
jgi:anaerobic selenocysteine-containing dehydrogenase